MQLRQNHNAANGMLAFEGAYFAWGQQPLNGIQIDFLLITTVWAIIVWCQWFAYRRKHSVRRTCSFMEIAETAWKQRDWNPTFVIFTMIPPVFLCWVSFIEDSMVSCSACHFCSLYGWPLILWNVSPSPMTLEFKKNWRRNL
jgi:hypothetical protein